MKVLIEISEKLYKNIVEDTKNGYIGSDIWIAVANGTPITDDCISRKALKEEVNKKQVVGRFNVLNLIDNAPGLGGNKNENLNQDTV